MYRLQEVKPGPAIMAEDSVRDFLGDLFGAVNKGGLSDRFVNALHEDLVWTATGTSPLSGVYRSKQDYLENVLKPLHARLATPVRPVVRRILVDGDWATVLLQTEGVKAVNGADFSMEYCWIMRVVDQRITEVIGFYDQKKMWDIFS